MGSGEDRKKNKMLKDEWMIKNLIHHKVLVSALFYFLISKIIFIFIDVDKIM